MSTLPRSAFFLRYWRWLACLALVGYALFLARHASLAAGGSDTSGYLNSARLLASGRLQGDLRIPAEFAALPDLRRQHFKPLGADLEIPGNPHFTPTYAPGMPLLLAAASKVVGWHFAPLAVELALALGAVLLCYALARDAGIDPPLAAAGAVILAACPVFLFASLQPLSDTAATTFCLAAFFCAQRAPRHLAWAAGCGLAFSFAILVRATNAVILPALALLLWPQWRALAAAAVAGLPAAAWLAYYNHTLYGGALRSGYGPIWDAFALHYGPETLGHFLYWTAVLSPALVLAAPALAAWRARSRILAACGLWLAAIVGVYLFYEMSQQRWLCLRFILPAFPALILAALLGLQTLAPHTRHLLAGVLTLWALVCSIAWTPRLHVLLIKDYERLYPEICAHARATLPPDALVASFAASGALYYYTDFPVLRPELIEPADFARYVAHARRPIFAVLLDGFDTHLMAERMPGQWMRVSGVRNAGIWRFTPPSVP